MFGKLGNRIKATAFWNFVTAMACRVVGAIRRKIVPAVWTIAVLCLLFAGWVLWPFELLSNGMPAGKAEFLRNIALGIVAALGFPLLLQRTLAATEQAGTDSRRLLGSRYARAAELFANAELSARLAGLYALWDLAKDEPKTYHVRIMRILCAFVRHPPKWDEWESGDNEFPACDRSDLAAVLELIWKRGEEQCRQEDIAEYQLNFEGVNLCRSTFSGAYLRGANFTDANLNLAFFNKANLRSADFGNARLPSTFLCNADLRSAQFINSDMEDVSLSNAAVNGADLAGANNLSLDRLKKAVVLTDEAGKDLPPGPPSLSLQFEGEADKLRRMTLREWEKKRGKKANP